MHRFEASRTVRGRTPEDVFDFVIDPVNTPDWIGVVDTVDVEGEAGVGRVVRARGSLLGIRAVVVQEITAFERPSRYAWEGDEPFPFAVDLSFTDVSDGTRIDAVVEADPGDFFPVGRWLVARALRRRLSRDADRLVRLLEE